MARAEVILELDGNEASVLATILRHVGGSPDGPRGCADSMRRALDRLNIEPAAANYISGGMIFEDGACKRG